MVVYAVDVRDITVEVIKSSRYRRLFCKSKSKKLRCESHTHWRQRDEKKNFICFMGAKLMGGSVNNTSY